MCSLEYHPGLPWLCRIYISIRTDRSEQTVQTRMRTLCLIRAVTVCYSSGDLDTLLGRKWICFIIYFEIYSELSSRRAKRVANEVSSMVENMIKESNIQRYILSAEIALTNFLHFSPRTLSLEDKNDWGGLDYTARHKIWVSLINVTKWQETSVSKCHVHILLIIFNIYYWFTHTFIYWYLFFNDAVKDFWRDYR